MNYLRLLGIAVLFVLVGLATVGGCGSSGGGGGDGNEDLGCEDSKNAFCERAAECDLEIAETVELCLLALEFIEDVFLDCEEIFNSSSAQDCVADLENIDCQELDIAIPASCSPEGACNICETDNDCDASQLCFECSQDCTGEVNRCSGLFFSRCGDGIF